MRWRAVALLGGASLLVRCSLITSLDDLKSGDGAVVGDAAPPDAPGPDTSTSDGSPNDAPGVDAPPPDSGSDAGGNLVTNPSFENGSGGCGTSWGNGYGMTFFRASPGHTGQYACEVCVQGAQTSYQLDDITSIAVQPGNYYAEAWVTTPDGGVAAEPGIQVYYTGDGGITGCNGNGTTYCQGNFSAPPIGSWTSTSTSFAVSGSGTVKIDVHSYQGTASSCFEVDDVALYQQ